MAKRTVLKTVRSQPTVDGAGVHLMRVLGSQDVTDFDPFLMLDSFDSTNPVDYIQGFPMHPHRGIETITYLMEGKMEHADSLGNRGVILAGGAQWMTAGSGVLHQEMLQVSRRIRGIQLWLNLPRAEKMAPPAYLAIPRESMGLTEQEGAQIRVLSGQLGAVSGIIPRHIPASIFDVTVEPGREVALPTDPQENVLVFPMEGEAVIDGHIVEEKTAVLFGRGDWISISAKPEGSLRFLFFSARPLKEPVAWGGPIVMNTAQELERAFEELRRGTFMKHPILQTG